MSIPLPPFPQTMLDARETANAAKDVESEFFLSLTKDASAGWDELVTWQGLRAKAESTQELFEAELERWRDLAVAAQRRYGRTDLWNDVVGSFEAGRVGEYKGGRIEVLAKRLGTDEIFTAVACRYAPGGILTRDPQPHSGRTAEEALDKAWRSAVSSVDSEVHAGCWR